MDDLQKSAEAFRGKAITLQRQNTFDTNIEVADEWSEEARKAAAEARKGGEKREPKTDLEKERANMTPKERREASKSDREKQGVAWKKEQERAYNRAAGEKE